MRTTAVQSVAWCRPSRPAPGRWVDSPGRGAFLPGLPDGQLALHAELGVVGDAADEGVPAADERDRGALRLTRPEHGRAAPLLPVALDAQVVCLRAAVADHEPDRAGAGARPANRDRARVERIVARGDRERAIRRDRDRRPPPPL